MGSPGGSSHGGAQKMPCATAIIPESLGRGNMEGMLCSGSAWLAFGRQQRIARRCWGQGSFSSFTAGFACRVRQRNMHSRQLLAGQGPAPPCVPYVSWLDIILVERRLMCRTSGLLYCITSCCQYEGTRGINVQAIAENTPACNRYKGEKLAWCSVSLATNNSPLPAS